MCAATVAVVGTVAATAATAGYGAYSAHQQAQQAKSAGGFTETQSQGFAPTKALQEYSARLLAANAGQTRPTLQEYAASGGTAKFPLLDVGVTPREAGQLRMVDPHTGAAIPYMATGQKELTPGQQVFLGQERYREGARGPLEMLGHATTREIKLRSQIAGAGPAQAATLQRKLGNIQQQQARINVKLKANQ